MIKTQAVLCGYYGYGNGGDEALLATLLQMLPEHITPLVLSGNPQETTALHGVESCDRSDPFAVLKAIVSSQALIWGGGSLIQDATSALSPLYYMGLMGFAQVFRLQTVAWAQGIGPLQRSWTKLLARATFWGCTAVSVRDEGSSGLVERWGFPHLLAPDPVWALAAEPLSGLQSLPTPRVAVVLRSHPLLTLDRLDCLTQALIQFQAHTQAHLLLVPFQVSQDLVIAQTLHAALPHSSQILELTHPQQLKGLFREVDMAIAMRLHALIMAAAEGCRCFAISYDPKVNQLMQDIRCPGWELDHMPDDPDLIREQWMQQLSQGVGLTTAEIDERIEAAHRHQRLLERVF